VPPASDGSTPSDAPPASARGGHRPAPAHPSLAPAEPNPEADRLIEEAEMNFVLDDRHKALNLVRQALTASPKMPAGLALLAALEASNVRDDDPAKLQNIIQRLDSILRSSPACRRGRYYRGRLKRRVGDFDGAVDDLREAVERDPDDLEAKRELRICEAKQKEPPKSGGSLLDRLRGR
jgi:tetratricopeptide (TPR) repeat protein